MSSEKNTYEPNIELRQLINNSFELTGVYFQQRLRQPDGTWGEWHNIPEAEPEVTETQSA
jgi:hypothetical protein